MAGRPWTERDIAILREMYDRDGCAATAKKLCRTECAVYQAARKCGSGKPKKRIAASKQFIAFLRSRNRRGWSDAEIAQAWRERYPGKSICRERVSQQRRQMGLPCNAFNSRHRARLAEKQREQLTRMGLRTAGQIRARALRQFAESRGWPRGLRAREVQILDVLYERGPMSRRQIAEAIGMNTNKHQRHWMCCKYGRGSYLANLMHYGLVVTLGKKFKTGRGKGRCAYVYAIPPHIRRGDLCHGNHTA